MISYRQAAQTIAAGKFRPAYLFCGDEPFLIRELSDELAAAYLEGEEGYGRECIAGAELTLAESLQRLDEVNLFASRRLLLVDNPPYLALKGREGGEGAAGEKGSREGSGRDAADLLEHFLDRQGSAEIPARIILFRAAAVDRRRRLFKLLEKNGGVVDCASLKGAELSRWIRERLARQGRKIEPAALQRLLWSGDNNLHRLSNELDKYSAYLGEGETTITVGAVELLFAGDPQGNVFTLTDALGQGKLDQALRVLSLLAGKREDPLRIFFMLVRHFRLLLGARSLRDEKVPPAQHPAALGVPPFVARKLHGQSAVYSCESLEEIIVFLQKLDHRIKTGRVLPGQALELAVAGIHGLMPRG